jgi:drug/metabolite transporter (DMT)-like permease
MMIGALFVIIGFVMVLIGAFSWDRRKGRWSMLTSMVAMAVGCYFIISGSSIISDLPQLNEISPMNLFGLIGGAVTLGKLIMWVITRTDFYKALIDALKSVPEIKKMVENIEKAITEGARK